MILQCLEIHCILGDLGDSKSLTSSWSDLYIYIYFDSMFFEWGDSIGPAGGILNHLEYLVHEVNLFYADVGFSLLALRWALKGTLFLV